MPDLIVTILYFLVFAGYATFPLAYHLRSQGAWRHYAEGRHLMASHAAFAVVLGSGVLSLTLGADYPGRDYVRMASYTAVLGVVVAQHVLMFTARRRARRAELVGAAGAHHPFEAGECR